MTKTHCFIPTCSGLLGPRYILKDFLATYSVRQRGTCRGVVKTIVAWNNLTGAEKNLTLDQKDTIKKILGAMIYEKAKAS